MSGALQATGLHVRDLDLLDLVKGGASAALLPDDAIVTDDFDSVFNNVRTLKRRTSVEDPTNKIALRSAVCVWFIVAIRILFEMYVE